jgi:hypothetical protein
MKEQANAIERDFLNQQPDFSTAGILCIDLKRYWQKTVKLWRAYRYDLGASLIIGAVLLVSIYAFLYQLALSGW